MLPFEQSKIKLAKAIAKKNGAKNLSLFGSFVRGESNRESDIDFLVEMNPQSTLLDLIAIKQDLEDLFGKKVDLLTKSSLHPYIREEVLREAIPL